MTALRRAHRLSSVAGLRRLCAGLRLACAAAWVGVAHAQMQASEVEVKVAYIYNFALFTTWPADAMQADAPMVLCVVPEHPLQAALVKLTGKSVHGHRVEVRRINDGAVGGCHVVVVGDPAQSPAVRVDPAVPVLTVTDARQASRGGGTQGAMITLALRDNRVVFDIDAAAARQARLRISSQLLRLARSVQ